MDSACTALAQVYVFRTSVANRGRWRSARAMRNLSQPETAAESGMNCSLFGGGATERSPRHKPWDQENQLRHKLHKGCDCGYVTTVTNRGHSWEFMLIFPDIVLTNG